MVEGENNDDLGLDCWALGDGDGQLRGRLSAQMLIECEICDPAGPLCAEEDHHNILNSPRQFKLLSLPAAKGG